MNHVVVRAIFAAANTAAEYIPGEGAMCPVCEQILKRRVRGIVYSTESDGIRYCRCNMCGISFKAVERDVPSPIRPAAPVGEMPENIDAKPKKRQSKSRKR